MSELRACLSVWLIPPDRHKITGLIPAGTGMGILYVAAERFKNGRVVLDQNTSRLMNLDGAIDGKHYKSEAVIRPGFQWYMSNWQGYRFHLSPST